MIYLDNVTAISELFTIRYLLMTLILSVIYSVVQTAYLPRFLQILQQNGYKCNDYFDWLKRRGNIFRSRLLMCSLLSFLATSLFQAAVYLVKNTVLCYLGFAFLLFFTILFVSAERKMKKRQNLVVTNRIKRLVVVEFALSIFFSFAFLIALNVVFYGVWGASIFTTLRLSLICLFAYLTPYVLLIANVAVSPIEKLLYLRHKKATKSKLKNLVGLKKVAITGSYGKTSIKNVLSVILSEKYKVFATPKSYNTPMGISLAVKELDASYDVFIVEMGARHKGDIKELCLMVEPDFGIVGGICAQHLKTFKSIDNIKETKSELIRYLNGDTVVLDCDNQITATLKNGCDKKVIAAGFDSGLDCFASDVVLTENGSSFKLHIEGKEREAYTKLLGKHNVLNIVIASAMAYELGLSVEQIVCGISKIEQIEHRLSVLKQNGVTVIDDSYNSNPIGAKCAIETVSVFSGRKIILTPGLVELGLRESDENKAFGAAIAKFFDKAVLIGANAVAIEQGMLQNGYDIDNIYIEKTFEDAKTRLKELVSEGDIVLFENDLPDKFVQ